MQGTQPGMVLDGKKVDTSTIQIDGIERWDYPDFADAYIDYAEYEDGTPLNEKEIDALNSQYGEWVNSEIHDRQLYL